METPNADRFMAILETEYEELLIQARKRIITLRQGLDMYAHTPYQRYETLKEIKLLEADIVYYSRGAENGESIPTVETTETPKPGTYAIVTEDMCILGM